MNVAFYAGATGLQAFQEKLNVIGSNISNSNTPGYKPTQSSFENLLYTSMYVNTDNQPTRGVGVRITAQGLDMEQGSLQKTGGDLDFAIGGEGFFAIENNGVIRYTRDGQFQQVSNGSSYYLGTADGSYVLDSKGKTISIPKETTTKKKNSSKKGDAEGTIKETQTVGQRVADSIGVYQFTNPEALQAVSSNRFVPTTASGEATAGQLKDGTYQLLRQTIEYSRTALADEMTNMIMAQRGFQLSSKVVQAGDEVEDIINNLRK